jgi:hypothetical protein
LQLQFEKRLKEDMEKLEFRCTIGIAFETLI